MAQRNSWGSNSPARRKGYRVLRYWADTGDGGGYRRRCMTVKGSRRDGFEILRDLWAKYGDDSQSVTMRAAFAKWWLPDATERLMDGDLAKNTYDLYMSTWRNHIAPKWADVEVDSVKPADVREWLLTMSKWTATVSKSLASMVAREAVRMGGATRNAFSMKYRIPRKAEGRDKSIWTLAELSAAAESARGTILEVPVILCGFGSCRVGEACAVRCDEVELSTEHGMLVARVPITRQLLKGGVSDKLKNPQSVRTVCVPEPWSLRLREIADANAADGLPWLNDNGMGEPVTRVAIKSAWSRFSPAGVERITMQNLRASWETFMRWELGVPADMVDSMMGHSGGIRERHYDRPEPDVYAETCAMAHLGMMRPGKSM